MGQFGSFGQRVAFVNVGIVLGSNPRQRIEGQSIPHRRVTRDQVHSLLPEEPRTTLPGDVGRRLGLRTDGQRIPDDSVQPLLQHLGDSCPLVRQFQIGLERIDVDGQLAFFQQVVPCVLVTGHHMLGDNLQAVGQMVDEFVRIPGITAILTIVFSDQFGPLPDRLLVLPPVTRQSPTRQLFARVPLALPIVQQWRGGKLLGHSQKQGTRQFPLGLSQSGRVPFFAIAIIGRDEGRLAPHRKQLRPRNQFAVHLFAEMFDRSPLLVGIGFGNPRILVNPLHRHLETEFHLGIFQPPGNRRRRFRIRSRRQWQVPFPRQQPGCRVETDPPGTRQKDLGPSMQIGEIHRRSRRPF